MPKLFRIGQYIIYFWSNENGEPLHVQITIGIPQANATKVWITHTGACILAHNKSGIPQKDLNKLMDAISAQYFMIHAAWKMHFNTEPTYYC